MRRQDRASLGNCSCVALTRTSMPRPFLVRVARRPGCSKHSSLIADAVRLRVVSRTSHGVGLDPWSDYPLWLTFCEGISYSADNSAAAESTCSRSLARSDQAARRKPAGTERQVEPTTGAQFLVPQIRIFSAPTQVSPCGFS